MSKFNRASLRVRIHFLFTGEIKSYWYLAEKMVLSTYLDYLMQHYSKFKETEGFDEAAFEAVTDFLNNPKITLNKIRPHILRFKKKQSLPGCYDFLPENFTK